MSISIPTTHTTASTERPLRLYSSMADWVLNAAESGLVGSPVQESILALDWFELARDPRATLVKSSHHRQTWRVLLGDGLIFAKVFDTDRGNLLGRLAYALGLGTAQREWRAACAAGRRGVPSVRFLGLGVDRRKRGRAVLLSDGLPDAISLSQAWESGASIRKSAQLLTEAVARLFASAHGRGFVHRDSHPGNILVQPTSDFGWEAKYVDVHGAYLFNKSPSKGPVVRSLAQLDHYFQRNATRSQRWRFLLTYISLCRPVNEGSERREFLRDIASSIARARATHAVALARQRDRRILRNGKYFTTIPLGNGWKGTFVLKLERRHAFPEAGVADRSELDWRTALRPILEHSDIPSNAHGLRLDRLKPLSLGARLRWTITGAPHRKQFIQSHRLRHRDIATELILGCLEHRDPIGLIDQTILIRPTSALHTLSRGQRTNGSN